MLDIEAILQQFELIEKKVEQVVQARKQLQKDNEDLNNRIGLLENQIMEKTEAEKKNGGIESRPAGILETDANWNTRLHCKYLVANLPFRQNPVCPMRKRWRHALKMPCKRFNLSSTADRLMSTEKRFWF